LGAPVGSVLISDKETIAWGRRIRKVMGGGMRQTGYLAAACIHALDHHIDRLKTDHLNARLSAEKLKSVIWTEEIYPVHTNIVIFSVKGPNNSYTLAEQLKSFEILCAPVNEKLLRWVFHLDITPEMIDRIQSLPDRF
jgi:threonine aldolase